jgi:hypothetical protein
VFVGSMIVISINVIELFFIHFQKQNFENISSRANSSSIVESALQAITTSKKLG